MPKDRHNLQRLIRSKVLFRHVNCWKKIGKTKNEWNHSKNEHVPLMNNACRLFLNSTDSRCYNVITNITPVPYNPTKITTASPPQSRGWWSERAITKTFMLPALSPLMGGIWRQDMGWVVTLSLSGKGTRKSNRTLWCCIVLLLGHLHFAFDINPILTMDCSMMVIMCTVILLTFWVFTFGKGVYFIQFLSDTMKWIVVINFKCLRFFFQQLTIS